MGVKDGGEWSLLQTCRSQMKSLKKQAGWRKHREASTVQGLEAQALAGVEQVTQMSQADRV